MQNRKRNEIDPTEELFETVAETVQENQQTPQPSVTDEKVHEVEQVMNNGMQFLAGLFKMSTGKDLGINGRSIEINKETGEVTMKFKLPVKKIYTTDYTNYHRFYFNICGNLCNLW